MSDTCIKIIEFLAPRNFYEYLSYPNSIHSKFNHFFGDIKSVTTSFNEENIKQYTSYINPVLYEEYKDAIGRDYTVSSNYDMGCYLAICSMFYRALSLTAASLQHKIATMPWQPHNKQWISTIVGYMPLALVYISSGPSSDILVACLVEKAVCGALSISTTQTARSIRKFVEEIDVIVKKHPFSVKDLVKQNMIVLARNLSLTLFIVPYLINSSIQFLNDAIGKEPSGHFHESAASVEICHSSIIAYSKIPTVYENVANDVVWVGGKLIVDLFIILLHKANVVEDLRYPLQGFLNIFDKPKIA
jgi:hypothetical protein